MLIASNSPRGVFSALRSTRRYLLLTATLFLLIAGATRSTYAATINVPAGGDLQTALDAAVAGDIIVLEAGATYIGPFTLPAKPASGDLWITIQSSASGQLPPAGSRVSPAHASLMPKLVSPGNNLPALRTAAYSHHYRLVGIEVTSVDASAFVRELVQLGDGSLAQNSLSQVPHHLTLERCYLHGIGDQEVVRAIALNSAATEVRDSYISNIKHRGFDSQAVWGWNGPGPFKIENNYLEAAGENAGFGGAVPGIAGLVPADIEFRRNTVTKPLAWRGRYLVKNLFELKSAERVLIEGNLFEHNWLDGQQGWAIMLSLRTEECQAMQNTISDVRFINNVVRKVGGGINVLGRDDAPGCVSRQAERLTITNNLFEEVDGQKWGGRGTLLMVTGAARVEAAHNTVAGLTGSVLTAYGEATTGMVIRDNLTPHGEYGIFGAGQSPGNATLSAYFPSAYVARNLIAGANSSVYPGNNFYPVSWGEVQFVDAANGNYRLVANNLYTNAGTDGKDVGVDFDQLAAAMKGEAMPRPTPTATPTPMPTATPVPTPVSNPVSPALVASAQAAGAALVNDPVNPAARIASLVVNIEQAYAVFKTEAGSFVFSGEIDTKLRAALYFARAAGALANINAQPDAVQSRLGIVVRQLGQARDLMQNKIAAVSAGGALAAAPMSVIGAAVTASSASGASVLASEALGSIQGDPNHSPLALQTKNAKPDASGGLPYELGGVSVTIGGRAAPLLSVSPARITFIVPAGLAASETEVIVTLQEGFVSRGTVTIMPVAPGIFTTSGDGVGTGLLLNASGTSGVFHATTATNLGQDKRTRVNIFATGVRGTGLNTNPANDINVDGRTVVNLSESVQVEARLPNGTKVPVPVEFAGAQSSFAGLDQVTVALPGTLAGWGYVELTLIVNGQRSNVAILDMH
ncbi:MAG TPA: hypothetical protein VEY11_18305 [Pyrinomonadaceae bacterium]|nr:hypothetical protein [Pyrinomonadaceae bacterium]